jgi:hypothetical protein
MACHVLEYIGRDSSRIHGWKLVHDEARAIPFIEPFLECWLAPGLVHRSEGIVAKFGKAARLLAEERDDVQDFPSW